jgi:hypothetical protein
MPDLEISDHRPGGIDRIEVLALEILRQLQGEDLVLGRNRIDHPGGDRRQSKQLAGQQTPLAGNQQVLAVLRSYDDGLQDPLLTDGFDKRQERLPLRKSATGGCGNDIRLHEARRCIPSPRLNYSFHLMNNFYSVDWLLIIEVDIFGETVL